MVVVVIAWWWVAHGLSILAHQHNGEKGRCSRRRNAGASVVGRASRSIVQEEREVPEVVLDGVPSALRSVCKIYVTVNEPDYEQPWSFFAEDEAVGSGFVVEDGGRALRVLTNAHVVRWASEVRVRRHGLTRRHKARVIGVSHEADLALLAIEDVEFWRAPVRPLGWAGLPALYDDVAVVGYPMGGDNVCVTRGVVSRVDTMSYARGAPALLVVQIDAAVNSGNSGGPALDAEGRVVGVAFSGYAGAADNIGYIIPESVARNFLDECAALRRAKSSSTRVVDASFVANVRLCALGIAAQPAENDALREYLKLGDRSGVLVTRVAETSCAAGVVRAGDVLLAVGGLDVADDGTVPLRGDERVDLSHAATSRRAGDTVTLDLLRDGAVRRANVTFAPLPRLVPVSDRDRPSYLVVAGLVLMPLTLPLLEAEAKYQHHHHDTPPDDAHLLALHSSSLGLERAAAPDAPLELVVWTSTLATDANFGFAPLCCDLPVLRTVNGHSVRSLSHAAELLDEADRHDRFYVLHFEPPNARPRDLIKVVLAIDEAHKANDDILRRKSLPATASPDILRALDRPPRPGRPPNGQRARGRRR
ncbi:hypothetical protein CTAYLR_009063 [Chrysophaeum taylorii]|uniref:PDZ domain-containing protein n=1 Tax=Chrysophaeum taylorii TaxID=2483200 RepID=A0AAD7ULL6_9STRA|nr:hypothetical protein CTAYLR_009063 [Chrysophaeum taylorii]